MSGPLAGKTVLVTGGAGFIGSHLVDVLVSKNEVRVLDDLSTGRREHVHDDATFVQGDIQNKAVLERAIDGAEIVFHQAAVVDVSRSVENPLDCHAVNVDATLSLLERARQEDARVVFASSAAIYGQPDTVPLPETAPKVPLSPYGLDKLAADHFCRLYDALYGLETIALRYFNVYGPRQMGGDYSGVIEVFLEQCRAGEPITVQDNGYQTRDFVHVEDVVRANLLAATEGRAGEAYNVGTGTRVSIRELAETVRGIVDTESDIVHTDARPGDITHSCADCSKAQRHFGFDSSIDLTEGLSGLVQDGKPVQSA